MHMHAPANERTRQVLKLSLVATLGYIVLTVVAGMRAHSLALLSEAGHNVSDFMGRRLRAVAPAE
jgi:cobalt-zinc-cadmium efflux system protein